MTRSRCFLLRKIKEGRFVASLGLLAVVSPGPICWKFPKLTSLSFSSLWSVWSSATDTLSGTILSGGIVMIRFISLRFATCPSNCKGTLEGLLDELGSLFTGDNRFFDSVIWKRFVPRRLQKPSESKRRGNDDLWYKARWELVMYWTSEQALLAFSNVPHFTSLLGSFLLLESPPLEKELCEHEGIRHVWREQQLVALLDEEGLPRRTL